VSAMLKEKFALYLEDSLRDNWEKYAVSDYNGVAYKFKDVSERILKLHLLFEQTGIKKQDKIALIGKNSAHWAIIYIATVTYGAVSVPILPDFMPKDIEEIVNHSDAKLLFSSDSIFSNLSPSNMRQLKGAFSVDNFNLLNSTNNKITKTTEELESMFSETYTGELTPQSLKFPEISNTELAMISYTSGTTGNSKGVMLSHNSLTANIRFARANMPLKSGDKIVSFLPLAHSYGLAFEFLFPFTLGCHITFLTKTPSPQIITKAFSEIKPNLILSVPLVIEKIYKKKLLPTISKPPLSLLLKVPLINQLLYRKINKKLTDIFGGNFKEVVIGGAAFNAEAELFFRKIKFPFTIGYGMTECGPLISYASYNTTKLQSSGKAVDTLEVRIDSEDQENIAGEILMRGDNVMDGYYKNEEASKKTIDSDGWLHSGDLGVIDKDGFIFIKGRSKSMILGASGQNIYPEEIESLINNKSGVLESVVIENDGKLVALICPDPEVYKKGASSEKEIQALLETYRNELNNIVPSYMHVSKFNIHWEEFTKTPKRSIKRYLYEIKKQPSEATPA
jgi:long-chain acyl-CoA synthetase